MKTGQLILDSQVMTPRELSPHAFPVTINASVAEVEIYDGEKLVEIKPIRGAGFYVGDTINITIARGGQ